MNYVCAGYFTGRWDKYQAMLEDLNLGEDDKLYILGDVIDRGEDESVFCRISWAVRIFPFFIGKS